MFVHPLYAFFFVNLYAHVSSLVKKINLLFLHKEKNGLFRLFFAMIRIDFTAKKNFCI